MRFRAVFFDAGETLVHPAPSFPELFAQVVTREGYPRDPVAISEGLAIPDRIMANPEWAMLMKTNYGAQFMQLVLPQLAGNIFISYGSTRP